MYRLAASSDHRPDAFENALGESDCRGKQPMNLTHEQELIFQTAGFPKEMTTSSLSCCCSRLQLLRSVAYPDPCPNALSVHLLGDQSFRSYGKAQLNFDVVPALATLLRSVLLTKIKP